MVIPAVLVYMVLEQINSSSNGLKYNIYIIFIYFYA